MPMSEVIDFYVYDPHPHLVHIKDVPEQVKYKLMQCEVNFGTYTPTRITTHELGFTNVKILDPPFNNKYRPTRVPQATRSE